MSTLYINNLYNRVVSSEVRGRDMILFNDYKYLTLYKLYICHDDATLLLPPINYIQYIYKLYIFILLLIN